MTLCGLASTDRYAICYMLYFMCYMRVCDCVIVVYFTSKLSVRHAIPSFPPNRMTTRQRRARSLCSTTTPPRSARKVRQQTEESRQESLCVHTPYTTYTNAYTSLYLYLYTYTSIPIPLLPLTITTATTTTTHAYTSIPITYHLYLYNYYLPPIPLYLYLYLYISIHRWKARN
jgi:hypothetical protein